MKVKLTDTPHQTETDLKIQQCVTDAEEIKSLLLIAANNKQLDRKVILESLYRANSICLILEGLMKHIGSK